MGVYLGVISQISGALLGSPCYEDHSILGSSWGSSVSEASISPAAGAP